MWCCVLVNLAWELAEPTTTNQYAMLLNNMGMWLDCYSLCVPFISPSFPSPHFAVSTICSQRYLRQSEVRSSFRPKWRHSMPASPHWNVPSMSPKNWPTTLRRNSTRPELAIRSCRRRMPVSDSNWMTLTAVRSSWTSFWPTSTARRRTLTQLWAPTHRRTWSYTPGYMSWRQPLVKRTGSILRSELKCFLLWV